MKEDGKRPCVESVRRTFSDVFVAYYMAHSFHWNVKGPMFGQFHDFFAEYSGDLYGTVDAWAENMLKLGADAPHTLDDILDNATISEVAITDDPMMMIQALHGANEQVLESLKSTFKLATELGYDGLADYTGGRIDQHEKWAWQLRVYMGSNGDPMHVGEMPGKSDADHPVVTVVETVDDQHVPEGVAYKVNNPRPEDEYDPMFFASEGETMAASEKGHVVFSDRVESLLSAKTQEHNKTAIRGRKTTNETLKAVYRRGANAFSVNHRPDRTRDQWAMTRVDAFLHLLSTGKPANSAYTSDNDLLPLSHPKAGKKSNSSITASALVPEERDMANAILEVVAKHGKFDEDGEGVWAGYIPAAANDRKYIGVKCENCVFYQGGDSCAVISLPVEPEGMCRMSMIPDGLINTGSTFGKPAMKDDRNRISEIELASINAELELSVELKDESEYETPEDAILALTEFSGLGYEAEPAIRASWLRAVRSGDKPFARAKHLAEFTYNSLDADLLPRNKKGE